MVTGRDFGFSDDPFASADEDVKPYLGLTPAERYRRFLDLMSFMERIWRSIDPERRAHRDRVQEQLDDPGPWWERVKRR